MLWQKKLDKNVEKMDLSSAGYAISFFLIAQPVVNAKGRCLVVQNCEVGAKPHNSSIDVWT